MSGIAGPTPAEDCERLMNMLLAAPPEGLTQDDIVAEAARSGEPWSFRTVNATLCLLAGRVRHERVRAKQGKNVTRYTLKDQQTP